MINVHLRNIKGIKEQVSKIQELDENLRVEYYECFVAITSEELRLLVRYNNISKKVVLLVYNVKTNKDVEIPIRYTDCIYLMH